MECDQASLVLKSGERLQADLIIAADGIHFVARAAFLQKPDPPQPTGDIAYRIVLNKEEIEDADLLEMVTKPVG